MKTGREKKFNHGWTQMNTDEDGNEHFTDGNKGNEGGRDGIGELEI
jgi:hypothetical protein